MGEKCFARRFPFLFLITCSFARYISSFVSPSKVLFTIRCRKQNICPSFLRLVDRLFTVIHKTQKTRTKVLPSATTSEQYFNEMCPQNAGSTNVRKRKYL